MKIFVFVVVVCAVAAGPSDERRGLLDTLTGLTSGTKLGTALKVMDAFGKVGTFINDLKNLAPAVHQALNGSIVDIQNSMNEVINHLASGMEGKTAPAKQTRGLLDALGSLTQGTKLGTAMKVIDAFGKVGTFINDLKNIAPAVHQALNGSIADIQNSIHEIVNNLASNMEGNTTPAKQTRGLLDALGSLTQGTKLGTAMKVIDAFGKVGTFINDLKNIAPAVHQALNGSIADIQNSMHEIVNNLASNMEGNTTPVKHSRGLLDTLTGLTSGTKLGTALKVMDAFGKVGKFINDLKNLAPAVHQALNGSIVDIQNSMNEVINHMASGMEGKTAPAKQTRGLLDTLTGLTSGTKLGTALKVMDAFGKVGTFINDLKNLAPAVHQALNGSIADIQNSMNEVINNLATGAEKGLAKHTRGLLDTLTGLTSGTKLGTAMKVVDAFSKVGTFINDLKNIAPAVHQALNGSIVDIQNSMNEIINNMASGAEKGLGKQTRGLLDTLTGLTSGTKLGTALKVMDAFGKVGTFINDLKNLAPAVHQALNGSIADIQNSMNEVINNLATGAEKGLAGKQTRGLLDTLTQGTKFGTAMKIIEAFGKVDQFINDVKNLAPTAHQALQGSIKDIQESMNEVVNHLAASLEGQKTHS